MSADARGTPVDDEAAFLAAMRAAPESRLTRHVYADWLEERGDPRHELVRVCEAMRGVPVWSDDYWQLKARRNELWTQFPVEWLEATGYDGSDYDPIFRDGVPDGVRERWRLIREFTERWHGVSVPDVGSQRDVIAREEARLGLTLPESVREFVAFAHDLVINGVAADEGCKQLLSHINAWMGYDLNAIGNPPSLSLMFAGPNPGGVEEWVVTSREDLIQADPRTKYLCLYPPDGRQTLHEEQPHLSLAILNWGFEALPAAGWHRTAFRDTDTIRTRLAAFFPTHARFADADVFESPEVTVIVNGLRTSEEGQIQMIQVIVRRPVPAERIPPYLFVDDPGHDWWGSSGMLAHASDRQRWAEAGIHEPQWVSVLRRAEAARTTAAGEPEA